MSIEKKLELIKITQEINELNANFKFSTNLSFHKWFTIYIHHRTGEVAYSINIGGEYGTTLEQTKIYLLDFLEKAKASTKAVK